MRADLICGICDRPMERYLGYVYGVHSHCARYVINKACNDRTRGQGKSMGIKFMEGNYGI